MLTLGITLQLCDIVFLLNDTLSSDRVMQMMYRSMTESKNKDKKCGFVIDMQISRVLNACLSYNIHKKIQNTEEKIKYLIEHHLINIDADYLINKKIDTDKIITRLLDIWKSDPINNLNILLKQLEDDIVEMDNDDQKALNKYFTKSMEHDTFDIDVEFKDKENERQEIKSGKEVTKIYSSDSDSDTDTDTDSDTDSDSEEDNKIKISFTKDVLPYVIPFACILTLKDNNNDFIEMLNSIDKNKELLEIFNEQTSIWWNNKGILEFIKKITSKYVEKNSNTFNIGIIMKTTLKSLIDKPTELLEFIAERLKPKDVEKKKFGEVFTPIKLVNEMLDKLPKEVWTNKDLKWLDPCCGIGNFPIAVYLRLMEGLKQEITDNKKRKKHILENMLYMCELNKKNVLITKQIFDISNEYNLNIHQGDFLSFDSNKIFNISKFDIIVGNPPYQEAEATGDNKLYLEFTKICIKLLKNDKYLLFITPRNILEYLLLVEKNRNYIDKFYQLKYIAIETSNKYFPKVGSTFAYFLLKKELYNEKTIIEYMYCNKIETIKIMLETGFKIPRVLTKLDLEILSLLTSKTNNYVLQDFMFDNKTQRIRKQHIVKGIVSNEKTDTHKIKIIDTINKRTPFPGKYYYYNLKDNVFNKDKLVLSKKGYLMPYIDKTKSYTYSDNFKYIIDDNLEMIKLLLESKIVKYLLFQYSKNGFDSVDIVKTINKKSLNGVKTEADLYKLYNLTDEYISHINNILGIKETTDKSKTKVMKKECSDKEDKVKTPTKKSSDKKDSNSESEDTDSEEEIEKPEKEPVKKLVAKTPIKKPTKKITK
jgi:hypothetical protein